MSLTAIDLAKGQTKKMHPIKQKSFRHCLILKVNSITNQTLLVE